MKYRSLCLFLLIFMGGNACSPKNNVDVETVETPDGECPQEPTATLASSNVKSISLSGKAIEESGVVSSNKHIGYAFTAESGQKLLYQTEDELCLWLYSPDNQLITTTELPATGQYTLQIAAPKGSQSFDLTIGLKTKQVTQAKKSRPSSTVSYNPTFRFDPENFPQYSCGDPKPSNPNDYPVEFYRVQVPYSETNLSKARVYFCRDALPAISQDTGEKVVQISSFTNQEKARDFAVFVNTQISGVKVGSPIIIYE